MLSKQKSSSMLKSGDSKLGKDESYISPNITVVKYEDEKIAKNIRTLFTNIKQHLNTNEENIENVIHTLIEGFNKSNKSSQELYDIGDKFIRKYLNKSDERTKFMKDFQSLIRDMSNRQKEESTKLDQKTLIKIDLNENEANREERIKLEKIRKTVKKYLDEHKIPEIYLDKEEYSIEPELKKKIYNYVMNLRSKFTTGNNLNFKDKNEAKKDNDNADIDEIDLINLN
jgi:Cu/Ag efflux pump CusA